jgi:virginiamycin B lyase
MRRLRPARTLLIALLALSGAVPPAQAAGPAIDEWPVPWPNTRPRDPYTVDGRTIWFCGQTGNYLGRLDSDSGAFTRLELPDLPGPHNLLVDEDGIVWYAGNLRGYIGRYDPASGAIDRIPLPDPAAADPHTLVFDANHSIWFTVQGGNFVGRLTRANRRVELIPVPTRLARPYGIAIAPDGRAWVVLFGTSKLAVVDPTSMKLGEIELPRKEARPRRLAITRDGRIWYDDYAAGYLGVYDPATAQFREWRLPGGAGSQPYAMAVDHRDRLWLVETGATPNRFVGFDPASSSFFGITPVPSGGGAVRHMQFHAATRTLWFGTDGNTIGRLRLGTQGE